MFEENGADAVDDSLDDLNQFAGFNADRNDIFILHVYIFWSDVYFMCIIQWTLDSGVHRGGNSITR